MPGHGAFGGQLGDEHVLRGRHGHTALRGAQAEHMVPARGVAQTAHEVRAVGHWKQALCQCHGRAAAAATGRFARVPGVAGGSKHFVEGVRTQAEFRRVGLADHDSARRFDTLDHEAIFAGHKVFHERAAQSGAQALGIGQVLDGLGHAVHPAHRFAACELRIALTRLCHQKFGFLQADDGIGLRIQARNAFKGGLHHFLARHLLDVNGAGQIKCRGIRVDHVVMLSGLFVL